jgi:hypothetical protein
VNDVLACRADQRLHVRRAPRASNRRIWLCRFHPTVGTLPALEAFPPMNPGCT